MKKIVVIGGGTVSHVRNHLALCAPAFGRTALDIASTCLDKWGEVASVQLFLTRMADPMGMFGEQTDHITTNEDVKKLVEEWVEDKDIKVVFFNAAICDFRGTITDDQLRPTPSGKYEERLKTSQGNKVMVLEPYEKMISLIRKSRKDIFLVAFKTTCGATEDEMYLAGLDMLKKNSCNLVLANDTVTRLNLIITPEEARYHVTANREQVIHDLVDMAYLRSQLTFTRSSVVEGEPVSWNSLLVPEVLRQVVNWCVTMGAYKVFNGATVGHFACKLKENEFLTSIRKSNFNDIHKTGMVRVVTDGPDTVLAYGAKPSVGGQSQRIVFHDHPDTDCIVHFHCPLKPDHKDDIPVISQREYECGSHQCGENTSKGLGKFGNLYCVMLDNHGPNIVFHHSIDSKEVTQFILDNFDLTQKTGGLVSVDEIQLSEDATILDKLNKKLEYDKQATT
jgi:hypothetical protein